MPPTRSTLRLSFPQWQGAYGPVVADLVPEVGLADSQYGYHLGGRLLETLAPAWHGPVAEVPISTASGPFQVEVGIYARSVVVSQLAAALAVLRSADPDRVVVLGGECSVSVAPFSYLAARYPDDLALLWLDAHPDTTRPGMTNAGFHSMAVSTLVGVGDRDIVGMLPATIPAERVLQVGTRSWYPDEDESRRSLGIRAVGPRELRDHPQVVREWLTSLGVSRAVVHIDLDVLDSRELTSVMGAEPDGLDRQELIDLLADVAEVVDLVGVTVAEYVPRDALVLRNLLRRLPLLAEPG